ncbi:MULTISPECIES: flagellar motor switch protein FliM [Marichromatium]|uniref:Flagellar motor switch protein FliM n=1 Tax=Marichromatium gracile TaxID=1048 RepID=A0A4R4A5F2_MARGR|nr:MULTISPECIES: flagellar motor switch protein FliM [Marichromatium]MBK1708118.1 flagellar motor switch protein FliM [Marichromatium gracile]RNE89646.1 flagellar motor switch protein FliM [Marichromatium sp. AB31]RNE94724.1 flagellar motor switch protein FliM [Marichromatium sp. AB32]TCW33415.1 flagellar motor switch protein FliM [Marichromatium gracile]
MAQQTDILSQDEIDALLHGVDSGDIDTEDNPYPADGQIRPFNLASEERIVRGRMPTLDMINERFARYLRVHLFNLLRRSSEISVVGTKVTKFSEYIHSLYVPTSLNLVRVTPLHGTALFVFDPRLVFTLVDNFFGGDGRYYSRIEGRDFTPMELRVIQNLLHAAFDDMKKAWEPVMDLTFEYVNSEVNPQFANIVSPTEIVVINDFHIELEGGGGNLHVTLPYSMIEPIRELLDTGLQSDRSGVDERWLHALQEEVQIAEVEIFSMLTEATLTVRELLDVRPGDIIPVELPETVVLNVEDIPTFRGKFGTSNGNNAIKITEFLQGSKETTTP